MSKLTAAGIALVAALWLYACTFPKTTYADSSQIPVMLSLWAAGGGCSGATNVFDDDDGFESPWSPTGNSGNWDSFTGSPTNETTTVHAGSQAMRTDAGGEYMNLDTDNYTEIWLDFWIYFDSSASLCTYIRINASTGGKYVMLRLAADNDIWTYDNTYGTVDTELPVADDTWTHMFWHIIFNGASSTVQIAVNTASTWDSWDYDNSSFSLGGINMTNLTFGQIDGGIDIVEDEFRLYQGADMPCDWQ